MPTSDRLTGVFKSSPEIAFDDSSKFIFFSDCHRGCKNRSDNFYSNTDIFQFAMRYYFENRYTYIEIGDGDELWENNSLNRIINLNRSTFLELQKFFNAGRLHLLWGNHDIYKKRIHYLKKNLYQYYNYSARRFEPLFEGLKVHEGLILKNSETNHKIFVLHGHQDDLMNDYLWPLSRLLVRYVWRWLEFFGFRNPFSPAENTYRMSIIHNRVKQWVKENNQMVISGHTHFYNFPKAGEAPYFNDGCCVYKNYITGIEISNGEIALVKWSRSTPGKFPVTIVREIIAGPEKLYNYFSSNTPL